MNRLSAVKFFDYTPQLVTQSYRFPSLEIIQDNRALPTCTQIPCTVVNDVLQLETRIADTRNSSRNRDCIWIVNRLVIIDAEIG